MDFLVMQVGAEAGCPHMAAAALKIGPPKILKELLSGRKASWLSIDITHKKGWSRSSELIVFKDGGNDAVGSLRFGSVAVAATVSIDAVPMAKAPSFALIMGHKLGSAQLLKGGEPC